MWVVFCSFLRSTSKCFVLRSRGVRLFVDLKGRGVFCSSLKPCIVRERLLCRIVVGRGLLWVGGCCAELLWVGLLSRIVVGRVVVQKL
jgi:hypothetical protein